MQNKSLYIKLEDEEYIKGLLREKNISGGDRISFAVPAKRRSVGLAI